MTSMPPPGSERRWGAYSLNAGPGGGSTSPAAGPDDLSRRLLQIAAGLSLLLILVVANYVLHSDGNPFNPIARAAERTQRTPGARVTMEAVYSSAALPQPIVATGQGVYNARTRRSRFTMSDPGSAFGANKYVAIGDDRTLFMRSEDIVADLPPGREWLEIQPWLGHTEATAVAGNGDTSGTLEMLRAVSDDVDSLGEETLRGVSTEHYAATIDMKRYAELLRREGSGAVARQADAVARQVSEAPRTEVWIDPKGIARKVRIVMEIPTAAGRPALTMDLRMEFFDFGISPRVHLPDPDRAFDATPLARAELDLFDGRAVEGARGARGPVLAAARFRARANAVCADLEDRAGRLAARAAGTIASLREADQGDDPRAITSAFRGFAYQVLEPIVGMGKTGIRKLGRLTPPAPLAADYARFTRTSAISTEMFEAAARAYEIGDLKLGIEVERRARRLSERTDAPARRLGLSACVGNSGGDAGEPA